MTIKLTSLAVPKPLVMDAKYATNNTSLVCCIYFVIFTVTVIIYSHLEIVSQIVGCLKLVNDHKD